MKTKTFLLAAALTLNFGLGTLNCSAQPSGFISIKEVPQPVQQKFKLLYPKEDIEKTQWEYEKGGYEGYMKDEKGSTKNVVFFSAEGKLEYAIYTTNGIRTGTEKEITKDELPNTIGLHLAKEHQNKNIRAVIVELDLQDNISGYRVIIGEDEEIAYNSKGKPE